MEWGFGENLAVVWLCGYAGGVEEPELSHNGRLHDKDRLGPDRAYHSERACRPCNRRRYLMMYPGIQVPKYPSTSPFRRQRSRAKRKSVGHCTPAISLWLIL